MKGRYTVWTVAALAGTLLLGGCALGPPPMVEWEDLPAVYEYEKPCRWDPYVRKRVYPIVPEDYWRLRDLRARPHLYQIEPEDEWCDEDEIRVDPRPDKPVPHGYRLPRETPRPYDYKDKYYKDKYYKDKYKDRYYEERMTVPPREPRVEPYGAPGDSYNPLPRLDYAPLRD